MTRLVKVFNGLLKAGLKQEEALMWAERIAKAPASPKSGNVEKTRTFGAGLTLKEEIVNYARSRKGNVWRLSDVALKTGAPTNSISAQITHLLKDGVISRTGRAEYVLLKA